MTDARTGNRACIADNHGCGVRSLAIVVLWFGFSSLCHAQAPNDQAAAAPVPALGPGMTGPLRLPPVRTFDAGPLGNLCVNGAISGLGLFQDNHGISDETTQAALSNGQIFHQKNTGWWQFYVQAGAYDIPVLGSPFLATGDTVNDLFGPLPVAYLKLVPAKYISLLVGALPTLIGAEYTFTFENMNIERGLLWNQENAVNRGVQVNAAYRKLAASLSWNDGFYSNRYTWLTGALTYSFDAHQSIAISAGGNFGQTGYRTAVTPVQNNSTIYALVYTYANGPWIIQPYLQFSDVPRNSAAGIPRGADTRGGALLVNYTFAHHVSLAARGEYLGTSGGARENSVNLLFGPGSRAWSATVTPTFQQRAFFVRGEFSFVRAVNYAPGNGFGPAGASRTQARAVVEAGLLL